MPSKSFKENQKKETHKRRNSKIAEDLKISKPSGPKLSDDEIFRRDIPNMILLVGLYMF